MGTRRQFSLEFKVEAVKLVTERGVAVAQAARDLDVHETRLRAWMREDSQQAFPGKGVLKPEQAEITSRANTSPCPYPGRTLSSDSPTHPPRLACKAVRSRAIQARQPEQLPRAQVADRSKSA